MKINSATVAAIPEFNHREYQVVFVTGQKRYDGVMAQLKGMTVADNVVIKPYIEICRKCYLGLRPLLVGLGQPV